MKRMMINSKLIVVITAILLISCAFAQATKADLKGDELVKDSLKSQAVTEKVKSDTGKEYTIKKHGDVISRENINKILEPQKGDASVWHCPLRSYIYPNYTGLTDDELLEHFKEYLEEYKKTELSLYSLLSDYYSQKNVKLKNNDKYENFLNKNLILLAEFVENHGQYTDPNRFTDVGKKKDELGNADLYEFRIIEIIRDNFKFYNLNDKIMCYNPPAEGFLSGFIDNPIPLLDEGQKVILFMSDKSNLDSRIFFGSKLDGEDRKMLNPYVTESFVIVDKFNIVGVSEIYLDTLIMKANELKSRKENFYRIKFNAE